MKTTGSMIIVVIATLLGVFFGNAAFGGLIGDWTGSDTLGGILGALFLGAISGAAAWYTTNRAEQAGEVTPTTTVMVQDPPISRFLFQDTRAAALWLPVRLFLGWEWLDAGLNKFSNPKWMDTGEAIRGYWTRAVAIPETGSPPISFEWWRAFLQGLLDANAHTWFAKVIVFGELAVGLGLILGALVGIAACGGILLNVSFLLSGSSSSNPVLLLLGIGLILAWKVAGWIGLDRFLLPLIGTPWQKGAILGGQAPPAPAPRAPATR